MSYIDQFRGKVPESKLRRTFIYLMLNKRNRFVKVGVSNNPTFREQTLQSEEPEIELIFKQETRAYVERFLHHVLKEKRVRGEWFELDQKDIESVPNHILAAEWLDPVNVEEICR